VGQKETEYGVVTGLPIKTRMWLDGDTEAVTTRAHDGDTGNLLRVTRPAQQPSAGGSGARTAFEYDSHELSVSRTTNELGHQVLKTYDVATGALLERQGPNFVTLPSDEILWERETWQIDGFGRVLSHAISLDDQYGGYVQRTVDRITYDDWAFYNAGQPNTIRTERLRDFDLADQDLGSAAAHGGAWVTTEQALDGQGRVLRSSQLLGGGLAADTTYEYDDRGNLVAIEAPDPRDDGARVRYAYAYDDLGRLTAFTRPDACGSGVSITYGGLEQTIAEATCDGSGGSRTKVFDAFGRLIELHEHDPAGPTAVTRYQYDANDNLAEIVDADGNITQLTHDWLGNRIAITRGARTWQYAYDLNGNLLQEIPPLPAGAEPDLYATAYAYDNLDRVTTISFADVQIEARPSGGGSPVDPNPRLDHQVYLPVILTGTSPADPSPWQVSERITNTIQYGYDDGPNGLGRLHQVTLPFGEIQYTYDARGLVVSEQRSAALDDIASLDVTQSVERVYNALGQLTLSTWDDGQQWRISHDARGLVDTVEWFDPGASAWQQVADYERLLAGLSHTRDTSYGQVRAFTYDALGRPATDSVTFTDDGGAVIAARAYRYTDSGDLAAVTGQTNGVSADATYAYDASHRLLSASGPSGYQGTFTHSPTGNILTADVTWSGSNETRHVSYEYGAVDPQAVDRLTDVGSGNVYAEFGYDLSGNMVTRSTPAGEMALTWDGLDQIRLAQGPNGAEVYLYDQSGARMLAISQQDGVRFWFGESETHYALAGEETRRYLHLSGGGPALARVENGMELELQYADTLQNLMFSVDTEGGVVASFRYGPFGEVVDQTGADDHRRQFNGKENDAVTGLRYYGYRYYDPVALRWNSADPLYRFVPDLGLSSPQRMNLYTFSLNNPVRYYDPDGRDVWSENDEVDFFNLDNPNSDSSDEGNDEPSEEPPEEPSDEPCHVPSDEPCDERSNEPEIEMEPDVVCGLACQKRIESLQDLIEVYEIAIELYEESIVFWEQQKEKGRPPSIGEIFLGIGGMSVGVVGTGAACAGTGPGGCALAAGSGGLGVSSGWDYATSNKPYTPEEAAPYERRKEALRSKITELQIRLNDARKELKELGQ
jgi:RHS repeat-associated protein